MNILIVGLGSIGQRHLRILKKIYRNKVTIYTLTNSKTSRVIKDNFESFKVKSLAKYYGIKKIKITEINKFKISSAFICNPPNYHLKTAIKLAQQNCHLFIEKPLSTEKGLSSINKLIRIAKNKKLVIRVGYQLRYHPGVEIIKNIIKTRDYGNILNGYFHFGEFTGALKKYENFSDSIYVKKNKGGGALLAFSHHLDLASYFFGKLKEKFSLLDNSRNFDIDVEDNCKIILTDKKNNCFMVNLNFLDHPQENFIILNFQFGSIKWNYIDNSLIAQKYKSKRVEIKKFKNFRRNYLFEKQTKEFFLDIRSNNFKNKTLHDSKQLTKLINDIKKKNKN